MGKKADPAMIAAMQQEGGGKNFGMFDNFKPLPGKYGAPVNQRQTANIHGYEGAMEGIPDMTEYMSQYMRKPADPATMTPESVQGVIPNSGGQKVRPKHSYSATVVRPSNDPALPARAGTGPAPTSNFASAEKVAALRAAEKKQVAADAKKAAAAADAKRAADAASAKAAKKAEKEARKRSQRKRREDGRCCFVAGTIVRMADGTDRPIEAVEIGDELLGQSGEINNVLAFDRPLLGDRKLYSINDGVPFVTSEHPFMTDLGWASIDPDKTAEENSELNVEVLDEGDTLETLDDQEVLEELESHTRSVDTPLYNFLLDGNHSYYANGYLVHNKQGDGAGGSGSGGGSGGGGGGGGSGGCFALGTLFKMADGMYKAVEDIEVGDDTAGGLVTNVIMGPSDRDWFDYNGTRVTDEHFVLEDGVWMYVKDAKKAKPIEPYAFFYTLDTVEHRLYGINGSVFSDDATFDAEHALHNLPYGTEAWDQMLEELNQPLEEVA